MNNRPVQLWGLLVLGGIYILYCLPLVFEAADDIAMVAVFSLDESVAAQNVRKLFYEGIWAKPSFTYGGLFYYVPVVVLKVLALFIAVDEHIMIIVLRFIGVVAGAGCLWMIYRFGVRFFDPTTGVVAAALFLPLPVFLRWSVEIHPDLLQAFWMLCCLYVCCQMVEQFKTSDAWLSAGCAGLAFGTKYGGVFLLPVIGVAIALAAKKEGGWQCLWQRSFVLGWVGVPLVFGLAFGLTNPHAILDSAGLQAQVLSEKAIMTFGHVVQADRSGWAWLRMVPDTMGWINAVAVVLSVIVFGRRWIASMAFVHVVLGSWVCVLLGYLIVEVRVFYPRHLLPVIPIFLLFVALIYQEISVWCIKRIKVSKSVVLGLLVVFASMISGQNAWAMFENKSERVKHSIEIEAGRWLAENYGAETTILYDTYAYVPSKFAHSFVIAPGHTFAVVNHFEPDIIVLRDARFKRFGNLNDASKSRVGKHVFYDIHYFYRFIKEGLLTDYEMVQKFDGVTVYRRVGARNHDLSFDKSKVLFRSTRLINVGRAREVMGDIHFVQESWTLAARDYALGVNVAPGDTQLRYKLGRAFVAAGDVQRGKNAFAKAFALITDISEAEWGNIHLDVAQSYFAAGFYSQAQESLRKARKLAPGLEPVHFDLAACQVALGDTSAAWQAYSDAVGQFGADSDAIRKLTFLKEKDIIPGFIDRVLQTYFNVN